MANRLLSDILQAKKEAIALPKTFFDKYTPTFQGWCKKVATLQQKLKTWLHNKL